MLIPSTFANPLFLFSDQIQPNPIKTKSAVIAPPAREGGVGVPRPSPGKTGHLHPRKDQNSRRFACRCVAGLSKGLALGNLGDKVCCRSAGESELKPKWL